MRTPLIKTSALCLTAAFLGGCGAGGPYAASPTGMQPAYEMETRAPGRPAAALPRAEPKGTEDYKDYGVNPVVDPAKDRFSTFAIDVDTASYAITRRKVMQGELPPYQAVRVEEFLNYFDYGYEGPKAAANEPFAVHLDAAPSPFAAGRHVLRVGVQGRRVAEQARKPVHLVYLVDTSGSMQSEDKIGLAKASLKLLTNSLKAGDTVALCTYAGSTREVLAPTGVDRRGEILAAIDDLTAGGSTAMESGIEIAYRLAEKTRVPGHVSRVVVLSDGDANVGATSHEDILKTIRRYKDKGITLSTVGFGQGNYKDTMMEQLADQGDGNYSYIDSGTQARRVFSEQVSGMLEVIAKDVKIQVEFDPAVVKDYRLIGYENRDIADKDFRNDKVDAGEIGAGHSVTAVYDVALKDTKVSPVKVRLRHKPKVGSEVAVESTFMMSPQAIAPSFDAAPASLRFAAAVTAFGEVLRRSPHAHGISFQEIGKLARAAASARADQQEFLDLVKRVDALSGGGAKAFAAVAR
jgi:Ca-activated chloride channel family protein